MPASVEDIKEYLEGYDDQKYIVGVEASYNEKRVHLIIHDPERGKRIERHTLKPFLWMKTPDISKLYKGDRKKIKSKIREFGIKFIPLSVNDESNTPIERLENGYKFLVRCRGTYGELLKMGVWGFMMKNIEIILLP